MGDRKGIQPVRDPTVASTEVFLVIMESCRGYGPSHSDNKRKVG